MSSPTRAAPLILIPTPVQDEEKRRFTLGRNYVRSVQDAGGVPVLVPVTLDADALRSLYERADGVLLTGGADLDPSAWGEACHPATRGIDPDRETAESMLARWAVRDDKALLGICRGVQQLNVALGGSLVQDIPSQRPSDVEHQGGRLSPDRNHVAHTVCVDPGTRLGEALGLGAGGGEVGVNSFHHQALKALAPGLKVTSRAPDGLVESVEMPDRRFVVAVQWHPEEMSSDRADMMRLFVSFVTAAREGER